MAADARFRNARPGRTHRIRVPVRIAPPVKWRHPALVFVSGFVGFIAVGTLVLTLPAASTAGQWTPLLDALFTSTSAVCVTGLVVVDTGTYWSTFGQVAILILVQLGGFGFMTSSTLLWLLVRRKATLRERTLVRESLGSGGVGSALQLARNVIAFSFVVEVAGALVLSIAFMRELEPGQAIWWGVFHSVSAFNNAGFDLVGGFRSLVPFNQQPQILLPISCLLIVGGISYTVVEDVLQRRDFVRLALDTKLVLVTTLALITFGFVCVLFTERTNLATLGGMSVGPRLLNALFTGVSPRTAGFNSIDTGAMTESGLFVLIGLMFVGGAAGSTAGGIKVQTFALLFFAILSAVRGGSDVVAFNRRIPTAQMLRVVAVTSLALAFVFIVAFALTLTERARFLDLLFEAFSAFGTVGMSTGITSDLNPAGRLIVALSMFAGRLGPLTLVLALAAREQQALLRWPEEGVKIG
jgi:trk system potassium uptake protein TrkH